MPTALERRILKWTVPVDDQWHPIGAGEVVHVACQGGSHAVQVWTVEVGTCEFRAARVYATGQPLPADAEYAGTALAGGFAWHVLVGAQR